MEVNTVIKRWMFSTIRINTEEKNGDKFVGTGFLFAKQIDKKHAVVYVVTNRHIVNNQVKGSIHFNEDKNGTPSLVNTINIPIANFANRWHHHPDPSIDVSIMQFDVFQKHVQKQGHKILEHFVGSRQIPSAVEYSELDAFEDLLFIGYPEGKYDKKNNTPIMRKGSSATPIILNYNGKKEFLIDAPIFSGSSGSPVFIHNDEFEWNDNGSIHGWIRRIHFVGIISQKITVSNIGTMVMTNAKKNKKNPEINENFHLGHVLKPECILETISDFEKTYKLSY